MINYFPVQVMRELRTHILPRSLSYHRCSAFVLLELLLAVLLLAVLAASVSLSLFQRGNRVAAGDMIDRIASVIGYARRMAVISGQPVRLYLDLDGQTYWLVPEEPVWPFGPQRQTVDTTQYPYNRPIALPSHASIQSIRLDGRSPQTEGIAELSFRPDGSARLATVFLRTRNRLTRFEIDPITGVARIESAGQEP